MEPDGQTDPVRVRSIHDNRMLAERAFYCFRKIFRVLRQFGRGCDRAVFLLDRNCVSIQ